MRRLFHVLAAGLLIYALSASYAMPEDQPVAPTCTTSAQALAQLTQKPDYDLQGSELAAFIKSYVDLTQDTAPDIDRLIVWVSDPVNGQRLALLVSIKADCTVGVATVPLEVFLKVYNGTQA